MSFQRSNGILLHPSSLPGKWGIGTLGKEAFRFIDWLKEAGVRMWQILPMGPTGYGDCPYSSFSAFAVNPYFIDYDILLSEGWLDKKDLPDDSRFSRDHVDFGLIWETKYGVLKKACQKFSLQADNQKKEYAYFCEKNSFWLDDFAFFMALKFEFPGMSWMDWPDPIRKREAAAMKSYREKLEEEIHFHKWLQFEVYRQWKKVKDYANQNGIQIVGDIPIYVASDSADAWSVPEMFQFDPDIKPVKVAGVPPDYFSATGQLWGNPLYDWKKMEDDGFSWWIRRIETNLEMVDVLRIDHFRGLAAYWAVPAGETTAINGEWIPAPGKRMFEAVLKKLGDLPIMAEDLGVITPDVEELRDHFQFPGMKILQFAFDSGEENDYLPHTYHKNCIVYTGTHDNDTVVGWYQAARPEDRQWALDYINGNEKDIAWSFIRAAWSSTALIAIAPLQDLMGLGSAYRMNIPGTPLENWTWRFETGQLTDAIRNRLLRFNKLYSR